jgi:hypothetical protein
MRRIAPCCLLLAVLCPTSVSAQEQLAIRSDLLFYGDNTEFRNPFREGETIFGAAMRVEGVMGLNERVFVSIGGFANQRFGSEHAFELVRPVLSLTIRGTRSVFTLGTLPFAASGAPVGPDHGGPHALLPPLQRETLSFDRPYEAGLAWTFSGSSLQHAFWLEWQRLNTPEHRERFDGGTNTAIRISPVVSIPVQVHIVHEGGQLHSAGPVTDSAAGAVGLRVRHATPADSSVAIEIFAVGGHHVPDRAEPDLTRTGKALLARASFDRLGWRAHAIFWRGRNFIKDEGDSNYFSMRRDGGLYRGTRDYAEAGLTRRFTLAKSANLEVAGRLHRVEGHYEYSFRVLSVVSASWKIR